MKGLREIIGDNRADNEVIPVDKVDGDRSLREPDEEIGGVVVEGVALALRIFTQLISPHNHA